MSASMADRSDANCTPASGGVAGEPAPEVPPETPPEAGEEVSASAARQEFLLDRLLYKGVLPRYAFPTDVATFYVFDENRSGYNRPAFRFSPSQGLAVALSQYAPGKEVWIASKRFRSGAIYSPYREERFGAWQAKRLYFECKNCHFASTRDTKSAQKRDVENCPACGQEGTFGPARFWFRPPGFAHPVGYAEDVAPEEQVERSYATRAKLAAPTPEVSKEGWQRVTDRIRVHYFRQKLLVTNTGPRQEGYSYCTLCGMIQPTAGDMGELARSHRKPYPDQKAPMCDGGRPATGVVLGTDFYTDILLVSLRVEVPVRLTPGALATEIALRTISEALAKAACVTLELEPGEVQADFRAALTSDGQKGLEAEVYLYDTLPGGAGFTRRVGEEANRVLARARALVADCDCETSCYKCLRSFKNKFEHDRLDRRAARDLLRHVMYGEALTLDPERMQRATTLLTEDVKRQAGDDVDVAVNVAYSAPGLEPLDVPMVVTRGAREAVVCVTHPLSPQSPPNPAVHELAEFGGIPLRYINELKVRRNLPAATKEVLDVLGLQS